MHEGGGGLTEANQVCGTCCRACRSAPWTLFFDSTRCWSPFTQGGKAAEGSLLVPESRLTRR